MRSRRNVIVLLAAACLGLVWLALQRHHARVETERRLAEARARQASISATLENARKTIIPLPTQRTASPAPSAQNEPPPPKTRVHKAIPGLMDLAHNTPDLWNRYIADARSKLQQRYGVLFQNLGLTAEQQERFKTIHAEGVARSADIAAAGQERDLGFEDPALVKLRGEAQKQQEAELVALLGEAGFRAYEDFDRAVPVRGFVDGLAVQLANSEPLTPAQAEQLARALMAASLSFQQGAVADPKTLDWPAVDRAAREFLSPQQYEIWKRGTAQNRYAGTRLDLESDKVFEQIVSAARAKETANKHSPK